VVDKEEMLRTCNPLAIIGVTLLAVAMSAAVFVLSSLVFAGAVATAISVVVFGWLWFWLPLSRR
jgi:hypothetical protein